MAVPCQVGPQESLTGIEKLFLFWVPMNIQKDWQAKLESAYSFMLKYSKITVCNGSERIKSVNYIFITIAPNFLTIRRACYVLCCGHKKVRLLEYIHTQNRKEFFCLFQRNGTQKKGSLSSSHVCTACTFVNQSHFYISPEVSYLFLFKLKFGQAQSCNFKKLKL